MDRRVLISGASIAGPTLAFWLRRYGFDVTVVERTPRLRTGLGGHAVDLFGASIDVVERMGLLPAVTAARTGTEWISLERPGKPSIVVATDKLAAAVTDRHVEIMRGELAGLLYEATRDTVDYRFGDSIRSLRETPDGVDVTFEGGAADRYAVVVGADGLHSNVRRLAFGAESQFLHYIGGYLGVFTLPNYLGLDGRMLAYNSVDRLAAMYPLRDSDEARALLLFRSPTALAYDHRDLARQRELLHEAFAGEGWEVPRLLNAADAAEDFYFDSISQIRMPTWSQGRVTLVGDAGYSPGPAVGGGTTLAVIGAYVLAGELAAAGGDHTVGLPAYQNEIRDLAERGRTIGPDIMKTLIPASRRQVWLTAQATRLLPRLPSWLLRRFSSLGSGLARTLNAITLKDYERL